MSENEVRRVLDLLWNELGGARSMPDFHLEPGNGGLPSMYAVSTFASAAVAVATAAVADLARAPAFTVNAGHAAAAFRSERYVSPIGWQLPPVWDPIAGDYRAKDGWVRVHTNYSYHRDAALRALEAQCTREDVTRAVAQRTAEDVESAIVREGGAAAMLRTDWRDHVQGRAVADEPLFASTQTSGARPFVAGAAPLGGVRVLDLTRVIAGPVCTRFLAAYGADVLRIDPPGFEEVAAVLPETTTGKRRAALDLRTEGATFLRLVEEADLLVCGYRASALERLGLGVDALRAANPSLGIILLDAYGWTGPWRERRGFDSLVQMSTGIAAGGRSVNVDQAPAPLNAGTYAPAPLNAGTYAPAPLNAGTYAPAPLNAGTYAPAPLNAGTYAPAPLNAGTYAPAPLNAGTYAPAPLPAQALDHGAGYLLAAAACRALGERKRGLATTTRLSLARIAKFLIDLGTNGDPRAPEVNPEPYRERAESAFGPLLRVRCPGQVHRFTPRWTIPAGPLGVDRAVW